MPEVFIHPHALIHGLSEDEIRAAWDNFVRSQQRTSPDEDECVRVGYGRETATAIQMIGVTKPFGTLIIHAMTPPQKSILMELGMLKAMRGENDGKHKGGSREKS